MLPNIADEQVGGLARTDELLKANFNSDQPRDEQGR